MGRPPGPKVGRRTLKGEPCPSSGKPQVFALTGVAATAPLPCPGRQSIRRAHLVRPPSGCPHRPAGAQSSVRAGPESILARLPPPATGFPPLPALRSDSPAPAPGKVWRRRPGCSVRWRRRPRPRGWREHAEAGAGEEPLRGPPTSSPRAPPTPVHLLPSRPASLAEP